MTESRGTVLLGVVLAGMAAGMGWGIRGQYGHETGAMMAGALFSLTIVFLYGSRLTSLTGARAAALCALGISIGGSMTYAQTVGLTKDAELIGNWEALRWGMLGLFIKGGIWIGYGGVLLGMGLSRVRYRPLEIILLLLAVLIIYFFGVWLLNTPYDPEHRILPKFYFSDHFDFEPETANPRRESWGGLLLALATLITYAGGARKDRLALWLGLWGFMAGAIGFPLGQAIQSWQAWKPETFTQGVFANLPQNINWWNFMETGFGAMWGAILALGVGVHRHLIGPPDDPEAVEITPWAEWSLALVHVASIVAAEFPELTTVRVPIGLFMGPAITMILIPSVCVMAGRYWPYLMTLPIMAVPICGKTVRQLWVHKEGGPIPHWPVFGEEPTSEIPLYWGVIFYIVLPLLVMLLTAVLLARRSVFGKNGRDFGRWALLVSTWVYFWLNFAFFRYPWPWTPIAEWTGRTPNGLVFAICGITLTLAALAYGWRQNGAAAPARADGKSAPPKPPPAKESPPKNAPPRPVPPKGAPPAEQGGMKPRKPPG